MKKKQNGLVDAVKKRQLSLYGYRKYDQCFMLYWNESGLDRSEIFLLEHFPCNFDEFWSFWHHCNYDWIGMITRQLMVGLL